MLLPEPLERDKRERYRGTEWKVHRNLLRRSKATAEKKKCFKTVSIWLEIYELFSFYFVLILNTI